MRTAFVSIAAAAFAFSLACSSEQSVLAKRQPGDGLDASGVRATKDAQAPFPDAPFVQPDSPPSFCRGAFHSTIPGASIVFQTERCVYTLAEVRAGIGIGYDLVLEHDVPGFVPPKYGYPYQFDTVAGLDLGELLSGGAQSYCLCDKGLPYSGCPLEDGGFDHTGLDGPSSACSAITLHEGTYSRTFVWHGVNWTGPSDTGNPTGKPFPPGDYTLTVSTTPGTLGASAAAITATFPVRLVR